jgi:hypothetical protein
MDGAGSDRCDRAINALRRITALFSQSAVSANGSEFTRLKRRMALSAVIKRVISNLQHASSVYSAQCVYKQLTHNVTYCYDISSDVE